MTPSQEYMAGQTLEDVADNIATLVGNAPEDEALDRLSGLLMDSGAAQNPPIFYLCFERLVAAGKMLEAVTCWRHFTTFLKDNAEILKDAAEQYAATVNVLGSFIAAFDKNLDHFAAFHIFSDDVQRALEHFDTVTMKSPANMMPSDIPPAAAALDTLSLGDRCLMDGDDMLAAAFFRRAAEEENNPEGWFRLIQLMSEADLGRESTPEKAREAKDAAIEAGFWYARPYYILRLLSAPEDVADDAPLDADDKKELQAESIAFVEDFKAFVKPAQSGFSKYTTPPVFQKAVHIYDLDKAEDVIKRLRAVTESNAMKVAIGTFAQTAIFMLMQGLIQKDTHLPGLATALETALNALADESADIADMLAQNVPDSTPFWEDQQHFGQVALSINGDIGEQLGELAQMLSE
jgi:hypothetical protein